MTYAVIVRSRRVVQNKLVRTKAGQKFWARHGDWGPTSAAVVDLDDVPDDVLTFSDRTEARLFAEKWEGHPWWCVADGRHEIVPIEPKYKTVQDGYQLAND